MKKEAGLRVLVWIGATMLLSTEASPQSRTSNACYSSGGDCGFHSLACERGLYISVQDMYYGFKNEATYNHYSCAAVLSDCSAYVTREPCCRYNVTTDCMTSYSREHGQRVKQDCDGQVSCRVRATDVSGSCSKPPKVYGDVSSYSVIDYVCVDVSRVTGRPMTTSPVVDCGPGCRSSSAAMMTSTSVVEVTSSGKEEEKEDDNDKRMLQLIIGVSIGVGAGFLFLFTALIVCWIRLQRKPPDSLSMRSGPSMALAASLPRRPSKALTLTSTMPSSHYSSFLYSDTLPSSHPNSVYLESIYSVVGNGSPPSSIGPASLLRANGYSNAEAVPPAVHPSDHLSRPPDVADRASLPPPPPSDSGSSAALPPQLPARPSILKPIVANSSESDQVGNGAACVVSTIQLSEKRSDSGASSSEHTVRTSPEGVQVTRCSQCSKLSVGNPSLSSDSNPRENGAVLTRYKQSSKTSKRSKSRSVSTDGSSASREDGASHRDVGSTSSSSHKQWWNPLRYARDSVQSDHASEASSVPVVPEETFVGGIPVSQHSQDKHDAVESWLGVVKPQVPF